MSSKLENKAMIRICLCLISLFISLSAFAQKDKQAKEILDKTSAALKNSGGINAQFTITSFSKNGIKSNPEKGTIQLKGNKFVLETNNTLTWFDGQTQWSYLKSSEEVNISNPTAEELQYINPYSIINSYVQGYNYKYNGIKPLNGQQVYEITMTPVKNKDISSVTLFISKNYQPLFMKAEQKDKTKNEVNIISYKTGEKYPDSFFKFNKKSYPGVEIIDLR